MAPPYRLAPEDLLKTLSNTQTDSGLDGWSPEKALVAFLLLDAIHCAYHPLLYNESAYEDQIMALEWLAEDAYYSETFSFLDCCEILNLDYRLIRKIAPKIPKERLKTLALRKTFVGNKDT